MVSTKEVNLGCLQRLLKKAMREVLITLFPAGNSFILDLTVRGEETATFGLLESLMDVVLQGPVRRTGKGPRTGPDCNRFKRTNSPGPLNFFEKDRKRPWS